MKKKARDLVDWFRIYEGKDLAEWFIELGKLDKIDSTIIRARRDNVYQYTVADICNVTTDTIKKRTKKLIYKYLELQKIYPKQLTPIKVGYYVDYCMINVIPDDVEEIYNVIIEDELFEDFESIKNEVLNRGEKTYGIPLHTIKRYKMCINGVYEKFDI